MPKTKQPKSLNVIRNTLMAELDRVKNSPLFSRHLAPAMQDAIDMLGLISSQHGQEKRELERKLEAANQEIRELKRQLLESYRDP